MTSPAAVWNLDTCRIGRRVLVYDVLESTNDLAASLADDPSNDGVAILAARQTAGRGQHGRRWQSPAGSAVLMSILCFPDGPTRRPPVLTAWAAVSVCEAALQAAGVEATIKWPNDVQVEGRKVCGILTEQGRGTVVGIGLNVNQSADDFAAAGLPEATSLRMEGGRALSREDVAQTLLRCLDAEYGRLLQGDRNTLEAKWRRRLGLLDRDVVAETSEGVVRGRLIELGFDAVLIEYGGQTRRLAPELVQHLRRA